MHDESKHISTCNFDSLAVWVLDEFWWQLLSQPGGRNIPAGGRLTPPAEILPPSGQENYAPEQNYAFGFSSDVTSSSGNRMRTPFFPNTIGMSSFETPASYVNP